MKRYDADYLLSVVENPRENMLSLVKGEGLKGSLKQLEIQAVAIAKSLLKANADAERIAAIEAGWNG